MLNELPNGFFKKRNGLSFLDACNDKDGNRWTDSYECVKKLLLLGMGIGKIEYILSRKMWKKGAPCIVISS